MIPYSLVTHKKNRTISPPAGKDSIVEGSSDKRKRIKEFD